MDALEDIETAAIPFEKLFSEKHSLSGRLLVWRAGLALRGHGRRCLGAEQVAAAEGRSGEGSAIDALRVAVPRRNLADNVIQIVRVTLNPFVGGTFLRWGRLALADRGGGGCGPRVDEGAALAVGAVVLGPVELLAELGFVVLRDGLLLLELVLSVGERALNKQRA